MQLDKLLLMVLAGIGGLAVLYAKLLDIFFHALLIVVPLAILYIVVTS